MASAKSPLLNSQGNANIQEQGEFSQMNYATASTIPDDLPPPYSSCLPYKIPCKVCGFMIDITGKQDKDVVKCSNCNEATPIKNAPPGKKYVRCPCQCLIICNSSSQNIRCPRPNCKRIIDLAPLPPNPVPPSVPGMCQAVCAHCHKVIQCNTLGGVIIHCPFCHKISSVNAQVPKRYGRISLIASFITLSTSIGITIYLTSLSKINGLIAIPIGLFLIFAIRLYYAIYYYRMKISKIYGPN